MWKPGRRLFSTAAVLMILTALAHTAGNLAPGSGDAAEKLILAAMGNYRLPMGMGMNPSMLDIFHSVVFTMSITFLALGAINLALAAGGASDPLLRRVAWLNAAWVAAFIALNVVCRIPPPLISGVVIELPLVAYLVLPGPRQA